MRRHFGFGFGIKDITGAGKGYKHLFGGTGRVLDAGRQLDALLRLLD